MILVEREAEFAALDAMFRSCGRGKGGVAAICGPVASGKTTLLRAFAEQVAGDGAIILDAVASRAERALPLRVLAQLLAGSQLPVSISSQVGDLIEHPGFPGPPREPDLEIVSPVLARVFEELLKALLDVADVRPVVLAVDDLQYADAASLQFLSCVARRAGTARILTVLTECPQALPADRLLHAEILRQGNYRCIPLAPMSPSGVARLLSEHLDSGSAQRLASSCHAMTGGNPALVTALGADSRLSADGLSRLVPGSAFSSAVVTCLHRYEPPMVELAQAVAVMAETAKISLLGELLDMGPESAAQAVDTLSTSGLLESERFRHEAARHAVLDHMTADERADMHGRVARVLYRSGALSAVLARHLADAHRIRARWTAPVLRDAAERALADGELDRAISYLRRAESECVEDRQRAAIRFMLAGAEWYVNPEGAARHLAGIVTDSRAGLLDQECVKELPYYQLWAGDMHGAAEILSVLDSGVPGRAGPQSRAWPMRWPLNLLYPETAKRLVKAEAGANVAARTAVQSRLQDKSSPLGAFDKKNEATVILAEGILQECDLGDPTMAWVTAALLALVCEDVLDRAAFWCDALMRQPGPARGSPLWQAVLAGLTSMVETRLGNLPAAEDHARTALNLLTQKAWGVAIGVPLSCLLLATIATRKHEDAAACLRVSVPDAMFGTAYGLLYLYARGEYYLATGRPQAALADFSDCGNRMTTWRLDHPGLVPWRVKAAEAYLMMGNNHRASELSREQLALAGPRPTRTRGISLRALARTRHPSKSTVLLREAAEVLRDSGARLELAYTFSELSNAYVSLGEHGRAKWAARQAQNLAERCGAPVQKMTMGKAGLDAAKPDAGVDAESLSLLSDAEKRVATLAAYGYTNTQIAHKLYITVSTVEQHLTRVYRKLGVTGRAELPIEI